MKIKFCGVKRTEDIEFMNEFNPDYVGFVFAGTKRKISPQTATDLAKKLGAGIQKVGVFVDEPPEELAITAKLAGLDAVQLHGDEDENYLRIIRELLPGVPVWKAIRLKDAESLSNALKLSADVLLFDSFSPSSYGGTGKLADLELMQKANINKPYFLAGGLNSDNITEIVAKVNPYGVDISSGIETNGVKDRQKIQSIMRILRAQPESGKAGARNG